jgi:hypothetical protein
VVFEPRDAWLRASQKAEVMKSISKILAVMDIASKKITPTKTGPGDARESPPDLSTKGMEEAGNPRGIQY